MNHARTKFVFVVFILIGFVSLGAADSNFNITAVDEPFSLNQTGFNSSTTQIVEIEYFNPDYAEPEEPRWLPVTPDKLYEGNELNYHYNKSLGNSSELEYLGGNYNGSGYWYADFEPNFTRGDMIKYNATGSVNHSEDEDITASVPANLTEDLNVGELELEFAGGVEDKFKAGREDIKINVRVRNSSTGNYITDSDGSVQVYFANASGQATSTNLDNYNDEENYFFNSEVKIPASTNSTYLMHVEASTTSPSSHGTMSKVAQTYPAIQGELTEFGSDEDCNNDASSCDPEAELDAEYEITAASATGVNVTAYSFNESGKFELYNRSMEQVDSGHFESSLTVPDLNTSEHMDEIEFEFEAYNNERTHVDRKNVTIAPFEINSPAPDAYTSEEYDIQVEFRKAYSLAEYNKSRFNDISVNVTNSSGGLVQNYTMDDLTFDQSSNMMMESFIVDDNAEGPYNLEVEATNIYDNTISDTFSFRVIDLNQTFDVSDVTFDVDTLWDQNFTMDISSEVDSQRDLEINDNLPDEITLNNDSISLSGNEEDILHFTVNLSEMEDVSGELSLEDSQTGYNTSVEIDADAADCQHVSGWICSLTASPIEESISSSGDSIIRTVEMLNIGPSGNELQFNISVNGEISDYLIIEGAQVDRNITGSENINLNYTARDHGNFSGEIVFNTENGNSLELNTSLEANVSGNQEEESGSISVNPSSIDLGSLPEGDSASKTIEVTNDGETTVSELSSSSSQFSTTVSDSGDIGVGESVDLTLEFENVDQSSGQVTIEGGNAEATISVSAEPVPDYSQRADNELRTTLQELQSQDTSTSQDEDLTQVSTKISQIQTAWDSGNYERAQTLYDEADQTLQSIENELNSDNNSNNNNESSSGGGIPILPVAGGIFALLLVVFVALTSYVPEEGDPLYGVLGE